MLKVEKILVLFIPLILVLAWLGGENRISATKSAQLSNISAQIKKLKPLGEGLYQARAADTTEDLYLAVGSSPSYGGPLEVAVVVGQDKGVRQVAVLKSRDTSSYMERVLGLGTPGAFIGRMIDDLPEVDTVSGATLSSVALIRSIESAAARIGTSRFGLPQQPEPEVTTTPELSKLVLITLLFGAALWGTSRSCRVNRRKFRALLLVCSVVTLGFWFGSQFSIATLALLLDGDWLHGVASYAALLCLLLAVVSFLLTGKNLFCSMLCPFGAVQEGLGKITGCSAPLRYRWMTWLARTWVVTLLAAGLYYHAPAAIMYEPFGKAFTFIGSGVVYALTILVVIASLVVKRPWCFLFCPATSLFAYLTAVRRLFGDAGIKQAQLQKSEPKEIHAS